MHQPSIVQRKRTTRRRAQRVARRVLPFLASLFLATPIAGPVNKSMASEASQGHRALRPGAAGPALAPTPDRAGQLRTTYQVLGAEAQGLTFATFERAMTGYRNLQAAGKLADDKQRLTVVDFDLPSTAKRLWVLDLATNQVLFHTLVAHGHNSGENEATRFSNTDASNMSSLGFYVTEGEYAGKHGRSLRLVGQDEGWNTNAATRSIVMHGADYVSEDFIRQHGRLGRSLGCPALPMAEKDAIIAAVAGGTCLFVNRSDAGFASRYWSREKAVTAS